MSSVRSGLVLPRWELVLILALLVELPIQLWFRPSPAPAYSATFIGPTPTADPRTWMFVPGDLMQGVLVRVDRDPETAFTPRQLRQVAAASQGGGPDVSEENFVKVTASVLDDRQSQAIGAHGREIAGIALEPDWLLDDLRAQASRDAPHAPPPPYRLHSRDFTAPYALASLIWLERHDDVRLSPAQARAVLPELEAWYGKLKRETEVRVHAATILTPRQLEACVGWLAAVRRGEIDEGTLKLSSDEVAQYFENRRRGAGR